MMLNILLEEIRSGRTLEVGELARRLDTSPEMIKAMLATLQRSGYLQQVNACDNHCDGCNLRAMCQPSKADHPVQLWQFEEPLN